MVQLTNHLLNQGPQSDQMKASNTQQSQHYKYTTINILAATSLLITQYLVLLYGDHILHLSKKLLEMGGDTKRHTFKGTR